jgi:hypothetical protein
VIQPGAFHQTLNRQLLCCGDATDLAVWSNIPYFLLQAGLKQGLLHGGLPLKPEQLRWQRRAWNLLQLVRTGKSMAITAPQFFFAQERSIADEAYAGDVVGLPNHAEHRFQVIH